MRKKEGETESNERKKEGEPRSSLMRLEPALRFCPVVAAVEHFHNDVSLNFTISQLSSLLDLLNAASSSTRQSCFVISPSTAHPSSATPSLTPPTHPTTPDPPPRMPPSAHPRPLLVEGTARTPACIATRSEGGRRRGSILEWL